MLSIVVPVYNVRAYLPQCLESLIGQTYRNLEIICVDDGSTDGSGAILDEYAAKDDRIKVIHQENAGVSAARNRGLDFAVGEYVTFVDGDDWIERDGYEKAMVGAMENVDIIHFGTCLDSWGETEEAKKLQQWFSCQLPDGIQPLPVLYGVMNSNVTNKLYRRALIEKYGIRFPEHVAYAEDLAFHYFFVSVAQRVYTLGDKIYHYVFRGTSAIGTLLHVPVRGLDHLTAVECVSAFLAAHKDASLPEEIRFGFFLHMYSQAKRFLPTESATRLNDIAFRVASELGVMKRKHHWLIQALLSYRYSKGKFYRFVANRDVFCFFGVPFFSISHSEGSTVYRFMGHKVYERCKLLTR